jgi:hypothetical protein
LAGQRSKSYAYERGVARRGIGDQRRPRRGGAYVEAKNNYEYLLFEDLKPAGLEAVQVRSGEALYAKQLKSGAVDRGFAVSSLRFRRSREQAAICLPRPSGEQRTG